MPPRSSTRSRRTRSTADDAQPLPRKRKETRKREKAEPTPKRLCRTTEPLDPLELLLFENVDPFPNTTTSPRSVPENEDLFSDLSEPSVVSSGGVIAKAEPLPGRLPEHGGIQHPVVEGDEAFEGIPWHEAADLQTEDNVFLEDGAEINWQLVHKSLHKAVVRAEVRSYLQDELEDRVVPSGLSAWRHGSLGQTLLSALSSVSVNARQRETLLETFEEVISCSLPRLIANHSVGRRRNFRVSGYIVTLKNLLGVWVFDVKDAIFSTRQAKRQGPRDHHYHHLSFSSSCCRIIGIEWEVVRRNLHRNWMQEDDEQKQDLLVAWMRGDAAARRWRGSEKRQAEKYRLLDRMTQDALSYLYRNSEEQQLLSSIPSEKRKLREVARSIRDFQLGRVRSVESADEDETNPANNH